MGEILMGSFILIFGLYKLRWLPKKIKFYLTGNSFPPKGAIRFVSILFVISGFISITSGIWELYKLSRIEPLQQGEVQAISTIPTFKEIKSDPQRYKKYYQEKYIYYYLDTKTKIIYQVKEETNDQWTITVKGELK